MTVISSHKNAEALSCSVVSEFDAGDRVWQVWEDPHQLERWWGPPTWPATLESHDFVPGGKASYFMTGPDGEKSRGWWRFTAIEAPHTWSSMTVLQTRTAIPSRTWEPVMP